MGLVPPQNPPLRLQQLAGALDAMRTPMIAWSARSSLLGSLVRVKGVRLAALCFAHAFLALNLVLLCPALLLVLGPLALGVVHVASDVRYLVLRYPTPTSWRLVVLSFCCALFALRVVETAFLENTWFAYTEVALVVVWVLSAAALAAGADPRRSTKNGKLTALAAVVLGTACLVDPVRFRMMFAHGHNLVGIALWYLMYARRARMSTAPLWAIAGTAFCLLVFGGRAHIPFPESWGLTVEAARHWLAPGVPDPYATGLVLSYAFLQSVHYAVWLIFIPQAATEGRGTPTFAMSLKSLWRDFGPVTLTLVASALVLVLGLAYFDPLQTQAVYLFVTPFHGYLEVAVLAYWFSSGSGIGAQFPPALSTLPRP